MPSAYVGSDMHGFSFLQAMAEETHGSARWSALAAGAVVARAAASALKHGRFDESAVRLARQQVARVSDLGVHRRLRDILDLMTVDAINADWRRSIGTRLVAYGVELHADGCYAPAADVFALVAELLADDAGLRMQALQRRAFALRVMSRFDDAETVYVELEALAIEHRDVTMELEARLGLGKLMINRGNIPAAIPIIEAVGEDALRDGIVSLRAKALIDRAAIAGIQNDALGALRFSAAASELLAHGTDRDRCHINMAYAYRDLGRPDESATLAREVRDHGFDSDQRALAVILLYHLAIRARDNIAQRMAREWLDRASLSPLQQAEYFEAIAYDRAVAKDFDAAGVALNRVMAIAESNQLAELIFRVEAALRDVLRHRVPAIYEDSPEREALPLSAGVGADVLPAARGVAGPARLGIVAAGRGDG